MFDWYHLVQKKSKTPCIVKASPTKNTKYEAIKLGDIAPEYIAKGPTDRYHIAIDLM